MKYSELALPEFSSGSQSRDAIASLAPMKPGFNLMHS